MAIACGCAIQIEINPVLNTKDRIMIFYEGRRAIGLSGRLVRPARSILIKIASLRIPFATPAPTTTVPFVIRGRAESLTSKIIPWLELGWVEARNPPIQEWCNSGMDLGVPRCPQPALLLLANNSYSPRASHQIEPVGSRLTFRDCVKAIEEVENCQLVFALDCFAKT